MNFDTPLVEYLIIGVQTSTWIYFICLKLLNYPFDIASKIDTAILFLLLPFIYIVGMIFDDLAYRLLRSRIKAIKDKVLKSGGTDVKKRNSKDYKDETLARKSEVLYNAYEAKVRRVRIIGSAIFNWPLLGFAIALNIDFANPILIPLVISTIVLTISSWIVWNGLNTRAYEFRKKAIDEVREPEEKIIKRNRRHE